MSLVREAEKTAKKNGVKLDPEIRKGWKAIEKMHELTKTLRGSPSRILEQMQHHCHRGLGDAETVRLGWRVTDHDAEIGGGVHVDRVDPRAGPPGAEEDRDERDQRLGPAGQRIDVVAHAAAQSELR